VVVRGAAAVAVSVTLVAVAALVVLADWRVYRTERLRDGAQKVLASDSPERFRLAAEYLEAATRVRPNDPAAWSELATVRLLAAPGSEQFTAGLRAARRARQALPLAEQPHLILGSYADRFVRSEPPEVHMARAKLVAGYDPGVWYTGGVVAAERGDWPTACADWRESLRRSPRYLAPIVSRCAGRLSPPEILASVLLDDPALGFAATPLVFPRPDSPGRGEWLSTLAQRWSVVEPATLSGYRNWAEAARAIDSAAEERVWRRAVERFPGEVEPRDGLAALLEAEERYADAVPVLEWLVSRLPDDRAYHDRLAAARHALRLKAEIDGP
jgi:tetratricopeptide (TPR) repeat protein